MAGKAREDNRIFDEAIQIGERKAEIAKQEVAELKEQLNVVHNFGLLAGRAQGFKTIKLLSEFLEDKQIAEIIDKKDYLKLPGVTSINDYLETLGLSRSTAYEKLKIARTLTVEEVRFFGQIGLTRRDLLGYSSLSENDRLEIMQGKVINLETASKEEIRDMIEQVISETSQAKEEAEADAKAKDRVLKAKEEVIKKQEKELDKLDRAAKKKGLTAEEDAFLQRMENSKTITDGFLLEFDPERNPLPEGATPRMRAAYMETIGYLKRSLDAAYDTAIDYYGDPELDNSGWVPPNLRKNTEG